MTVLAMTLPLARSSPVHQPRRDIVTFPGDDLTLNLAVIADDAAGAAPVNLTGATVEMQIHHRPIGWDYGRYDGWSGHTVRKLTGTITNAAGGLASIVVPPGSAYCWGPHRVDYTLHLNLGDATRATLARGAFNLSMALA